MRSRTTLVEVAADLRRRAGQMEPAFSTRRIVEVCFPDAFVTGARLPPGIDEMVSRRLEGPTIVYARSLPGPAQRFVIAHALAHLLFDDASACARPGRLGIPANEELADLFAAELLVPLHILEPHVTLQPSSDPDDHELYLDRVDEIASLFAVPANVIESQIRRLGSDD